MSAIASGNQKEALSHAGAAGQDLVRLAVNSNQRSQLLSAFGLLGFKVTLSGLFRALVGAPLRLVRIISDTIVLVAATNFGSSPIVITAWAPF